MVQKLETEKSVTTPEPAGTVQPVDHNAITTKRSEQAQELGGAAMKRTRKRFGKNKDDGGQGDNENGGRN